MPKRTRWEQRDPEAAEEARKYARPVPSRTLVTATLEERGVPMRLDELADTFRLDREERSALGLRLRAMVRDGQLLRNRRGGYCLVDRIGLVTGTVSAHRDGYGFVAPDRGGADVYLPPRAMREAMHGDRVAVRVRGEDRRGRPEGVLVEVLERNTHSVVGRYLRERGAGFLVPEDARITHRIAIPSDAAGPAKPGQVVLAELTAWPTRNALPVGRITRVLGAANAPGMEIEIAIHTHGLPTDWPPEVEAEARALPTDVPAAAARGREDLRELPLVTIDGEDARDFDDAVYCEPTGAGWRLVVAIADVAHYVTPDSPLDQEAEKRGTSVYFTRRVLPMLPEALSNGLCSLNPEVDRLCTACEMRIGRDGKLSRARFFEGILRSRARLTYTEVAAALFAGEPEARRRLAALLPHLEHLRDVFHALHAARRRRGAIDFEIPEAYVELGEDRRIESIGTYERNDAHRVIEECMIAANVAAARFLARQRLPALYRVHDKPPPDKVRELRDFLETFGVRLPATRDLQPKHFAQVLERIKGGDHAALVETVMLRTMARASYQPDNLGHFGLALPAYVHFTSPIRRYPDLLVHRAVKHALRGRAPGTFRYSRKQMDRLGRHCSMMERRADDATRDAIAWLKCEFMQDKIGREYDGVVTGVAGFGLFVQLEGVFIEGLVHVSSLENDYYELDAAHHRLVGSRTKITWQLADSIRVRVVDVDMDQRRIDFEPVSTAGRSGRPRRPPKARGKASKREPARSGRRRDRSKPSESTKPKAPGRKRSSRRRRDGHPRR